MKSNAHKTSCVKPQTLRYNPSNQVYRERAQKVEKDSSNTNIFNGKNLSDNTPASFYYQCKAAPQLKDAELRVAQ